MKEARIQNANLMVIAFSILQYPQTNIFAQHTQSRRHILSITFYCRCFNFMIQVLLAKYLLHHFRWRNFITRGMSGTCLLTGFSIIVWMGPIGLIFLVS